MSERGKSILPGAACSGEPVSATTNARPHPTARAIMFGAPASARRFPGAARPRGNSRRLSPFGIMKPD